MNAHDQWAHSVWARIAAGALSLSLALGSTPLALAEALGATEYEAVSEEAAIAADEEWAPATDQEVASDVSDDAAAADAMQDDGAAVAEPTDGDVVDAAGQEAAPEQAEPASADEPAPAVEALASPDALPAEPEQVVAAEPSDPEPEAISDAETPDAPALVAAEDASATGLQAAEGLPPASDVAIAGLEDSYTYTGFAIEPDVTVSLYGTELTDATIAYASNVAVGTATVSVTSPSFEGTATASFRIAPASLGATTIQGIKSLTYTGQAQGQNPTVTLGSFTLKKGRDYTVSYKNNKMAGTASITFVGQGNFSGKLTKTFAIRPASIAKASVSGVVNKTYNGKRQTQKLVVKLGKLTLSPKTAYTVSYKKNLNAGKATVVIRGKGNYTGTITRTFTIARRSIKKARVTNIKRRIYNGKRQTQKPVVRLGVTKLKAGRDYSVRYKRNLNAGKATIIIQGKGNYKGIAVRSFRIVRANFAKARVAKVAKQLFTGKAIKPKPVVKMGSRRLRAGRDYTLSYANNKAVGMATITIRGKGNYSSARKRVRFAIYQANIAAAKVGGLDSESYTGGDIKPDPVVTYKGRTLRRGVDYSVSYSNNRYGGTATITITGKRGFRGTTKAYFYIDGPEYVGYTVYITDTGAKYHRAGCRYLYSSHAVDLGVAQYEGYEPCGVCNP